MARPETTYNDNTGLYDDENVNSFFDSEGREPADGAD